MHTDELDVDESLARRLLAAQFPQWANLRLVPVRSAGTDNALFRLGDDIVVRLPRIAGVDAALEKEHELLPRLAPYLPVAIPFPLAAGAPMGTYPWRWSVYLWLEGHNPPAGNHDELTEDLIAFVDALRHVDLADGPSARRGGSLAIQDEETRAALAELSGVIDTVAATAAWNQALQLPEWVDAPVWVHGDLLPGNLLVKAGRLTGVIDWAGLGVGDPACDMIAAWALLSPRARESFRRGLRVDDAAWARGRGWALSIGLIALPYYKDTNPEFAVVAHHLIRETLADDELGA